MKKPRDAIAQCRILHVCVAAVQVDCNTAVVGNDRTSIAIIAGGAKTSADIGINDVHPTVSAGKLALTGCQADICAIALPREDDQCHGYDNSGGNKEEE